MSNGLRKNSLLERSACFTGLRVTSDESAVALGLKQHWTYLQPQKHLENLVPGAQTACSALSIASSLTSRSKCGVWREAQQAFVHTGCAKNDGFTEGWGVGGAMRLCFLVVLEVTFVKSHQHDCLNMIWTKTTTMVIRSGWGKVHGPQPYTRATKKCWEWEK